MDSRITYRLFEPQIKEQIIINMQITQNNISTVKTSTTVGCIVEVEDDNILN